VFSTRSFPRCYKQDKGGVSQSVESVELNLFVGTRYRTHSLLRHCATSRKVTGLIPDEIIGFFNRPNPAALWPLGSTQPLTEMSTRNLPTGKGRPALTANNLTVVC
jgi:hypothetical protein